MKKTWWKEAIIYQIYPRSFYDANGDGIGDLQGVIARLDYLQQLGIDIVWMSPFFQSPNADNGYDISDYQAIMSDFGTIDDFHELLEGLHTRGMKLIIDLVVNHSSDEHRWFQEARKAKDNPYRDYYIWRDQPNDWVSFFSGSAWDFDPQTAQYYLHLFAQKQPDLNWENPKLRQEIYAMMHFWLQKGVDGFRMDVISLLSKDTTFANYPEGQEGNLAYYANGPRIHEFLQEMNQEVLAKYDCFTVGEGFGVSVEEANDYVGQSRHELHSIYHFDHAVPREEYRFLQPAPEFTLIQLKEIMQRWDDALGNEGWQGIYWGNHDNPRAVSRFGDKRFHRESATMLATILMTLRGNPYIYQGDEIGMTNCLFESVEEFDDIQVKNAYKSLVQIQGGDEKKFLKTCNQIARDHARTPMQWDDSPQAGFTKGSTTWLKVNPNYTEINVKKAENQPDSILHFYRKLIQLRKQTPALVYGTYQDLRPRCNRIYTYTRSFEGKTILVVCNFKASTETCSLPKNLSLKMLLMSNYATAPTKSNVKMTLRPFEACIYLLD